MEWGGDRSQGSLELSVSSHEPEAPHSHWNIPTGKPQVSVLPSSRPQPSCPSQQLSPSSREHLPEKPTGPGSGGPAGGPETALSTPNQEGSYPPWLSVNSRTEPIPLRQPGFSPPSTGAPVSGAAVPEIPEQSPERSWARGRQAASRTRVGPRQALLRADDKAGRCQSVSRPAPLLLPQAGLPPLWESTTSPFWDMLPAALTWPPTHSKRNKLQVFKKPEWVGIFHPRVILRSQN